MDKKISGRLETSYGLQNVNLSIGDPELYDFGIKPEPNLSGGDRAFDTEIFQPEWRSSQWEREVQHHSMIGNQLESCTYS